MKKFLSVIVGSILLSSILISNVFAQESGESIQVIPQTLVEENIIVEENGFESHEYVWENTRARSTVTSITAVSWVKHSEPAGTLRHRAAKIAPNRGSSAWYAWADTDYPAWHYSRVRIVKTIGGAILEDSNQVQKNSGVATAKTSTNRLYLDDWDFSMRSYWGN